MTSSPTILFICTGNIFRSMTAEVALRASLGQDTTFAVRSAGLIDAPHTVVSFVADYLLRRGIDVSAHQPVRLTPAMLEAARLPVAMGTEHRDRILEQFGHQLPLFSEIAFGTVEALKDVDEVVEDWRANMDAAQAYGEIVMDYIFDGMPGFIERLPAFLSAEGDGGAVP